MKQWIDNLFAPLLNMLAYIQQQLDGINLTTAKGVSLNAYLYWIGWLGPKWVALIQTLIVCITLLLTLYVVSSMSGVIRWFKTLIKWW